MPNPNPNRYHHHCTTHHHHATPHHHHPPPKPHPKLLSIFLKFIVMSLILSLFLLFLGLAAILLLHLLLAGSFLHRRRQRQRQRLLLHPSPSPPPSPSYTLHDIHTHLPPFHYSLEFSGASADDCSICLEFFKEGEVCRALPDCDHVFHAHCVDTWLTKVPSCPICRTRIRLDAGGPSDSTISDEESKFLWAMGVRR